MPNIDAVKEVASGGISQASFGDDRTNANAGTKVTMDQPLARDASEKDEKQSLHSFGTGSFTTNTFNNVLKDSAGMKLLKYVSAEDFGKFGESIEFMDKIQVSSPYIMLTNGLGIHHQDFY